MDFTSFFWKKNAKGKKASNKTTTDKSHTSESSKEESLPSAKEQLLKAKSIIDSYQQQNYTQKSTEDNLKNIKKSIEQPKEPQPDQRFDAIKAHLGQQECMQTLREERWYPSVHCPYCQSTKIKRLAEKEQRDPNIYRYLCLVCRKEFDDDTETPFEQDNLPPLHVWIQCWYLMGCTSSIQYIATKLGLDQKITREIIRALQKLFNKSKPLTHLESFDEWSEKHAEHYEKKIKEALTSKKQELMMGETTHQPEDTREVDRQRARRRDPKKPTPGL